jgi:hypothetical protein
MVVDPLRTNAGRDLAFQSTSTATLSVAPCVHTGTL